MNYSYEHGVPSYARIRQTEPHIAKFIQRSLHPFNSIVNVGAGLGSYEPQDKQVIAVEPSMFMCEERIRYGRTEAVMATVEAMPFQDKYFEAGMAIISIHQWKDLSAAFRELSRIVKHKILILTFDPMRLDNFWTMDYFPELIRIEQSRFPRIEQIAQKLNWNMHLEYIPIPINCRDGFQEAFYGRPEEFLNSEVRQAQSAWSFLDATLEENYIHRLTLELQNGSWDRLYGFYRKIPFYNGSLCIIEFSN